MGVPPNGGFIWETPIKMDLGVPLFQETPIYIYVYIWAWVGLFVCEDLELFIRSLDLFIKSLGLFKKSLEFF